MIQASRFQSDEFMTLLTDALRAGPGSPQWREVVTILREENPAETDEYRLLITARERLESGREYRSVRAGPNFTRKVLQAVEQEPPPRHGIPSATLIALIAAAAILTIIIVVGVILSGNPPADPTPQDLASTYFGNTVIGSDFSQSIPPEWRPFGLAPVISAREKALRGGFSGENSRDYQGGGLVTASALAPGQSFAIEAAVRMARATADVDLFVFLTDEPTFDRNPAATSPREFVVELNRAEPGRGQVSVFMPDGTLTGQQASVTEGRNTIHLLIKVDRRHAIVELDGKQLYAGPHGLPADKARYAGLRFLTKGAEKSPDDVVVQSVRVLKP